MASGNPDQDSKDEIVLTDYSARMVRICELDNGFSRDGQSITSSTFTCDSFEVPHTKMDQIAVGDLDYEDTGGADEIVISDYGVHEVYIYKLDGGSLVLRTELGSSFETMDFHNGSSLAIGDLDKNPIDGENYAEIAVSNRDDNGAWIYRWNGSDWEFVVLANGWGDASEKGLVTNRGRLGIGYIFGTYTQAEMIAGTGSEDSGLQFLEKRLSGDWRLLWPDVRYIYETDSMLSRMYPVADVSTKVSLMVMNPAEGTPRNHTLYQKLSRERALANDDWISDKHYTYVAMFNGDNENIKGGQSWTDRRAIFALNIGDDGHVIGDSLARHEIGHTRGLGHTYVPICSPHDNGVMYPYPEARIAYPGPEPDFRILNSETLASTTLLSGIEGGGGFPRDVVVDGNYAYVALYNRLEDGDPDQGGLAIYDITHEHNPILISLLHLEGGPRRLVLNGNYAYVVDVFGGLYAVNISDPENPYITDHYQLPEILYKPDEVNRVRRNAHFLDLHLVGDELYAAAYPYVGWSEDFNGEIINFDVSIPSQFRTPLVISGTSRPFSVFGGDSHIYVGSELGFEIYASGDYTSPIWKENIDKGTVDDRIWDVYVVNDTAYLGGEWGLLLYDVSVPTNTHKISDLYFNDRIYEIEVIGDYAYLATERSGLKIVDVSDPGNPVMIGEYATPGTVFVTSGLDVDDANNRIYLATWDSGVYGMDTGDLIRGFDPVMKDPYEYYDFMSYSDGRSACGDQWMSVHTYYILQDEINNSWVTHGYRPVSSGPTLHLTGYANLEELNGGFSSLMKLPGGVTLSGLPPTSTVHLTLEDGAGILLADYPLETISSIEKTSDDFDYSYVLDSVVSYITGTYTITLVISDTAVATQTVSTHPPTVTLTIPNGGESLSGDFNISWTAGDLDGDDLSYLVLHSPDGGTSWTIIAEIQHQTSVTLTTDFLVGSTDTYFRVIASDGVLTAFDDSDSPLTIEPKPPEVWIGAPVDGSHLHSDQTFILVADAWDPDLKEIEDDAYVWSSSLDGALGTGKEFYYEDLSPGIHQITVTVTDADGGSDQDTVVVYVDTYLVMLPLLFR